MTWPIYRRRCMHEYCKCARFGYPRVSDEFFKSLNDIEFLSAHAIIIVRGGKWRFDVTARRYLRKHYLFSEISVRIMFSVLCIFKWWRNTRFGVGSGQISQNIRKQKKYNKADKNTVDAHQKVQRLQSVVNAITRSRRPTCVARTSSFTLCCLQGR